MQAILDGAQQIAVPAFVSTLCICIVFVPMFFLTGVARYLFVPLAEAVVFAMLASYLFSRTLVPTLAMYLLKEKGHGGTSSKIRLRDFEKDSNADSRNCAVATRHYSEGWSNTGAYSSLRFWRPAPRCSCWSPGLDRTSSLPLTPA